MKRNATVLAVMLAVSALALTGCSFRLFGGIGEPAHAERTKIARRAVGLNEENAHAWFLVGRGMLADGEEAKAVRAFRKAIEVQPDFVEPRLGIARIHVREGKWKSAEKELHAVLEIEPDSVGAFEELARCSLEQERLDEALKWAGKAAALDPESPRAHRVLGEVYYIRGQYPEAVAHWTHVSASDIDDAASDLRNYVAKYRN